MNYGVENLTFFHFAPDEAKLRRTVNLQNSGLSGQPSRPGFYQVLLHKIKLFEFLENSLTNLNKNFDNKELSNLMPSSINLNALQKIKLITPFSKIIKRTQALEIIRELLEVNPQLSATFGNEKFRLTLYVESFGPLIIDGKQKKGLFHLNIQVDSLQAKRWLKERLEKLGLKVKQIAFEIKPLKSETEYLNRQVNKQNLNTSSEMVNKKLLKEPTLKKQDYQNNLTETSESKERYFQSSKENNAFTHNAEVLRETEKKKTTQEILKQGVIDRYMVNSELGNSKILFAKKLYQAQVPEMIHRITEIASRQLHRSGQKLEVLVEVDTLGKLMVVAAKKHDNLHLQIHVESENTRQWLESQVRSLINQLNQEGIEIERLQVSVNGENLGHQTERERKFFTPDFSEDFEQLNLNKSKFNSRAINFFQRSFGYNTVEILA